MGAEFILPGNRRVEETACRLGLGLWEKGMAYGRREPRGREAVTEARRCMAAWCRPASTPQARSPA